MSFLNNELYWVCKISSEILFAYLHGEMYIIKCVSFVNKRNNLYNFNGNALTDEYFIN